MIHGYGMVNFGRNVKIFGPKKALHSVAYDSQRKHVVLFGGADGIVALSDTWELKVEIHP